MICKATSSHYRDIADIYNYYILNSHATFELDPVSAEVIGARIEKNGSLPWLVFLKNNETLGYAYASGWKERQAYLHTCEVSVYVRPDSQNLGIASALYPVLLSELQNQKLHMLIAGIALPNQPSIRLHENLGFSHVGTLPQVGRKFDRWIDVGYWLKSLHKAPLF